MAAHAGGSPLLKQPSRDWEMLTCPKAQHSGHRLQTSLTCRTIISHLCDPPDLPISHPHVRESYSREAPLEGDLDYFYSSG